MAKGEKDVLASREKYDHDNWHAANIIANSDAYPSVMKTWAEMIIAKGRPVKRGENRVLVDIEKPESVPVRTPEPRLASANPASRFRLKL